MSKRNWLLAITLGGWLGVSLLLVLLAANGYGVARGNNGAGYRDTSHDQQAADEHVDRARVVAVFHRMGIRTIRENTPCDAPKSDNEKDLCQQWRMAKATESIVDLTKIQVIIGFLTCIGLGVTIYFSIKATRAALSAATAAEGTLKHAQETAQIELRAYIVLKEVEVDDSYDGVRIAYRFAVTGATPAKEASIWVEDPIYSTPHQWPNHIIKLPIENDKDGGYVAREPDSSLSETIIIPEERMKAFYRDEIRIFVIGGVQYKDVFLKTPFRYTQICHELIFDKPTRIALKVYKPLTRVD